MTGSGSVVQESEYEEGKGGLVFFGVVHLLVGAVVALLALTTVAAVLVQPEKMGEAGYTLGLIAVSATSSILAAAYLVWMGVGSMLARRWARALIVVVSSIWLVKGVSGLVKMLLTWSESEALLVEQGKVSAEAAPAAHAATTAFSAVVFVLLPAALVLFYSRQRIAEKVRRFDPVERWTDRVPLSVLALVVMFLFVASTAIISPLMNMPVPLFGAVVIGAPAVILSLAVGVLCAWISLGLYRMDPLIWKAGIAATVAGTVSVLLTILLSGEEYYAAMKLPGAQKEMMQLLAGSGASWISFTVWPLLAVGLFLFTKKYFGRE